MACEEWGGRTGPGEEDVAMFPPPPGLLSSLCSSQVAKFMAHQRAALEAAEALRRGGTARGSEARLHRQLRIVSGAAAGKSLLSSQGAQTRPMMEKVSSPTRLPCSGGWWANILLCCITSLRCFAARFPVGLECVWQRSSCRSLVSCTSALYSRNQPSAASAVHPAGPPGHLQHAPEPGWHGQLLALPRTLAGPLCGHGLRGHRGAVARLQGSALCRDGSLGHPQRAGEEHHDVQLPAPGVCVWVGGWDCSGGRCVLTDSLTCRGIGGCNTGRGAVTTSAPGVPPLAAMVCVS